MCHTLGLLPNDYLRGNYIIVEKQIINRQFQDMEAHKKDM